MKLVEWNELVDLLDRLFPDKRVSERFSGGTTAVEWQKAIDKIMREHKLELNWIFEGARLCGEQKAFLPSLSELKSAAIAARDAAAAAAKRRELVPPRDWVAEWKAFTERFRAGSEEARQRARLAAPVIVAELAEGRYPAEAMASRWEELVALEPEALLAERERVRAAATSPFARKIAEVTRA